MDRLEMIDDIRKYANLLMLQESGLNYADATKKAKIDLFGSELNFLKHTQEENGIEIEDSDISYIEIANRELAGKIRVDLYTEEQLKEIIIAKRMGVDVESFINIFYTPMQIRVITLAAALDRDITPYTTNLYFDPKTEMKKLEENSFENLEKDKTYLLDKAA